ncbi:tRNA selenocysteine 1-associated protein [Dirofilaria immitis]
MGDLSPDWDQAFIAEAFARMGEEVTNVKIVFDKHSGKQAGYCFIEFADRESARRAMLHINGKIIPKSKPFAAFNLSFANSPNAPYTEYNLFVNNVPQDMDDAALFLIFGERYESCRGAKVYRNTDGTSKGLGFVRFSDQTDQQRALLEMNKYRVDGKQLILKLAQPKYRAPRQPRNLQQQQQQQPQHNVTGYDITNNYLQTQENVTASIASPTAVTSYYPYNTPPVTTAHSVNTYHAPYNYPPVQPRTTPQQAVCEQYYSCVVGGAIVSYEACGVEPVEDVSAEQSNEYVLQNGEEFYEALEQSRWSKVVFDANMCEDDLLKVLG